MSAQGVVMERIARETTEFVTAGQAAPSPRAAGPFLYPSGARPLAGYTIKRGVGQGGFGEIYFATSDAGKEVALKLIRRNLEVELRGMRQCLNLRHPNLLDLYDIRQDDQGDTWVVMEYVAGQGLEDMLAAHPAGLPPAEALAWFQGIAAGVAHLHDHGIVHRDLKPGNIFCDEGVVKIGDYGLSKFISCSRRSGHTESIGTVHYMAPEVANGRYGKEIDIYALGVILYELLTGQVPFDGESVGEVLMKHLTAQPDVSVLAHPFRGVVARALEKDPAKRFRSASEMAAAVNSAGIQSGSMGFQRVIAGVGGPPSHGPAVAVSAGAALAGASGPPPPRAGQTSEPPPVPVVFRAEVVDEEPIWRAVRGNWIKLGVAWDEANLAKPVKVVLLVLAGLVCLNFAAILVPLAFSLLLAYGVYRFVRMIVLSLAGPPPPSERQPVPAAVAPPVVPRTRRVAEHAVPAFVLKSARERFTDLVGSLLAGALVALAMCVVMVLVSSYLDKPPAPELCAWLALAGIAGTWAVLVPAKFWEGTRGEPMLRRFILMVVGLGLGLLAFFAAQTLLVQLPFESKLPSPGYRLPPSFYGARGQPLVMAYMAVFAGLLAVLRWWRQADPWRTSRLSLGFMIVSVAMAAVVAGVLKFPQPWLMMVAGIMSVSVQVASPWVPPRDRLRPQRKTIV
jgi:hypothetical protein